MSSPFQPDSSAALMSTRFDLCFRWHIVAADKKESGVHENKLPDRSLRYWNIGGISRNGTTLCQHFRIRLNVRSESDLNDVMNAIGGQSPDLFRQLSSREQNLVRPCSQCDLLVAFGSACGDHSRSCAMSQLNRAGPDRTSPALHKNGSSPDRTRDMNSPMSRYPGNAETCTLLQRH